MSKMLKIIALLLVIAAVVFVAGCAGKTPTPINNSTVAPEQVTPVATTPVETPAKTPTVTPAETPAETTNYTENVTANITSSTPAVPTAIHMNSVQRHQALIKSQQQSTGAVNVTL
jgi:PBP1b-binding outer membrane lipoprotein LpoB